MRFFGARALFLGFIAYFALHFGLFEANWAHYGSASRVSKRQFGYPHQIVSCHSQIHPELIAVGPFIPELATASNRFEPAEDLLHPLPYPLAYLVTLVTGRPPVQYCGLAAGYVGRHNPIPAAIDEMRSVVVLVGSQGDAVLPRDI